MSSIGSPFLGYVRAVCSDKHVRKHLQACRLAIIDTVWAGMPCIRSVDRHVKHRRYRFS